MLVHSTAGFVEAIFYRVADSRESLQLQRIKPEESGIACCFNHQRIGQIDRDDSPMRAWRRNDLTLFTRSEIRSTKSETNQKSESQMSKTSDVRECFDIRALNLFRIPCFGFERRVPQLACPAVPLAGR